MVQRSVRVSGAAFEVEAPVAAVASDKLSNAPIKLIEILCIACRKPEQVQQCCSR